MSSLFNTTATMRHVSPLPPDTAMASAVAILHDHARYLSCNPHRVKHEPIPTPTPTPMLRPGLAAAGTASPTPAPEEWSCFRVTDVVHTLPKRLWDSEAISEYEFCKLERGVFVRIRCPMGIVMEAVWSMGERAGAGEGLEMVEEVQIKASRFLVPVVRVTCEGGWKGIHDKMLAPLVGGTDV